MIKKVTEQKDEDERELLLFKENTSVLIEVLKLMGRHLEVRALQCMESYEEFTIYAVDYLEPLIQRLRASRMLT